MIQFENIRKRFGDVDALRGVSLGIAAGERVAFVGSNGSGKTTLLRALVGLLHVQGRVQVAGMDVAVRPELALRHIAYVPQIAPPLEATVDDLARTSMALRGRSWHAVAYRLTLLGLDYDTVRKTRMRDLSGGMRQKILAALALAAEAPILVCDEPTANLDPEARAAFFAQVDALPQDQIVVLCSHRLEEVRQLVERVVELREGRVVRDAGRKALLEGLPTSHVEVTLSPHASTARAWLEGRGLRVLSPTRLVGQSTQAQKLEIVAELAAHHWDVVEDLTVRDVDDLASSRALAEVSP